MGLLDNNVIVKEAFLTVSGKMYAVIECLEGILTIGTTLMSESNDRWIITEASLMSGSLKDKALGAGGTEDSWFLFEIEPLEHNLLPSPNKKLLVIQHGS